VLIATLDELLNEEHDADLLKSAVALRDQLVADKVAIQNRLLHDREPFQKMASLLQSLANERNEWAPKQISKRQVLAGLRRTYKAGRETFRKARVQRSVETLHAWRKQAKYLRYQCETLGPLASVAFAALAKQADALGELLGRDHDLAMLLASIPPNWIGDKDQEGAAKLASCIQKTRSQLQSEADILGKKLYSRKPAAIVRTLEKAIRKQKSDAAD
jgi:CHAD domain-containing protein